MNNLLRNFFYFFSGPSRLDRAGLNDPRMNVQSYRQIQSVYSYAHTDFSKLLTNQIHQNESHAALSKTLRISIFDLYNFSFLTNTTSHRPDEEMSLATFANILLPLFNLKLDSIISEITPADLDTKIFLPAIGLITSLQRLIFSLDSGIYNSHKFESMKFDKRNDNFIYLRLSLPHSSFENVSFKSKDIESIAYLIQTSLSNSFIISFLSFSKFLKMNGFYLVLSQSGSLLSVEITGNLSPSLRKKKLKPIFLVVDDNIGVYYEFRSVLLDFGIPCYHAENYEKALDLASNHRFSYLFSDIHIPDEIGGSELLDRLIEESRISETLIEARLMTSGNSIAKYRGNLPLNKDRLQSELRIFLKTISEEY